MPCFLQLFSTRLLDTVGDRTPGQNDLWTEPVWLTLVCPGLSCLVHYCGTTSINREVGETGEYKALKRNSEAAVVEMCDTGEDGLK